MTERHRVVIIGGGFGGLRAARALKSAPVDVTLIDRRNYHLFQPLLYQVATAGLSAPEIASPIRSLLAKYPNAAVRLDEVLAVSLAGKSLTLRINPEVAHRLKSREGALLAELEAITGKDVIIKSDPTVHQERFEIF